MQPTIARILFTSLIFALGIAPTSAMWVLVLRKIEFVMPVFLSLTIVFVLLFVPLILLQNGYLYFKRTDEILDKKLTWLSHTYFVLNGLCLASWIGFMVFTPWS